MTSDSSPEIPLTDKQAESMARYFNLDNGDLRTNQRVQLTLPFQGVVPEASLLHCAGVDPTPFWEERGLKGYRDGRDAQKAAQLAEYRKAASRVFGADGALRADVIHPHMEKSWQIHSQLMAGGNPFADFPGLAGKDLVLVIGFWRSMGTLMLWRTLSRLGIPPLGLLPYMIHDNMPELQAHERWPYWGGRTQAMFQFSQFLAYACGAYDGHTAIVQKNSSHLYWLDALDSMVPKATFLFSYRHPVPSAVSLFSTFVPKAELGEWLNASTRLPMTDLWWPGVERATGMARDEWDRMTMLERAVENWGAYHLSADLTPRAARRLHILKFGDDLENFLGKSLPFDKGGEPAEDERVNPSTGRSYESYMTVPVQARVDRILERIDLRWRAAGIQLPEVGLI